MREQLSGDILRDAQEAIRYVLADARGRRFLFKMFEDFGLMSRASAVAADGRADPIAAAHREGCRSVVIQIYEECEELESKQTARLFAEGFKLRHMIRCDEREDAAEQDEKGRQEE